MKGGLKSCSFITWTVAVLTVLGMSLNILPAIAKQQTIRVMPEAAMGGLTIAEQKAHALRLHEKLTSLIPLGVEDEQLTIEIDQKEKGDLSVIPTSGTEPLRVGIVKKVPGAIGKATKESFNFGVVESRPNGSFVWAMEVKSPGAQAIRLHLTDFFLPDNTEMYFLGTSNQAHGPYTGKGRRNSGEFWTRSLASDTGVILISYTGATPDVDRAKISLTISDVGHIRGRPPQSQVKSGTWPCSDNADCLVDVNCVDTGPAAPAENAVAKMEWVEGGYIYTCSGGLLADTDPNTQIPYFLTANHCLSTSNTTLETFFNYTTTSCEAYCPDNQVTPGDTPPLGNTIGVTVVATGEKGDFTLLTLDEQPPAGAIFLGWNNSPIASTSGAQLYRISNPNFGPQAYSQHNIDSGSPECPNWPRGERIYSKDQTGATMGGSSGSPVLNSEGEVVGQLSGSCGYNIADVCDSAQNWTVDGALAFYWEHVDDFLNPVQPECGNDSDCNDGLFCNGQETCSNGVCQSGTPECNDNGLFCDGSEYCDEEVDECISTGNPCGEGVVCDDGNDTCLSSCGNGRCDEGENCDNCSDCAGGTVVGSNLEDCFKDRADGVCHARKDGPDCPDCAVTFCCGNGICEDGESSSDCDIDCASDPAPSCGDGNCDPGEQCSCSDCPVDAAETNCNDGIDNDCNGFTDLEDENCSCGEKKSPCTLNSDCCSNRCSVKGVCL